MQRDTQGNAALQTAVATIEGLVGNPFTLARESAR